VLVADVCHLHVEVTSNPDLAPPGRYMLFLCDDDGVPSVAQWIHLGPAPARARPERPMHVSHHQHLTHGEMHKPGFPIPGSDMTELLGHH
jgi:hypothetical protein